MEAEEVVEILSERWGLAGRVMLTVRWENGGVSEASLLGNVRREFPGPVEEYIRKRGGEWVSTTVLWSPSLSPLPVTMMKPRKLKRRKMKGMQSYCMVAIDIKLHIRRSPNVLHIRLA